MVLCIRLENAGNLIKGMLKGEGKANLQKGWGKLCKPLLRQSGVSTAMPHSSVTWGTELG